MERTSLHTETSLLESTSGTRSSSACHSFEHVTTYGNLHDCLRRTAEYRVLRHGKKMQMICCLTSDRVASDELQKAYIYCLKNELGGREKITRKEQTLQVV